LIAARAAVGVPFVTTRSWRAAAIDLGLACAVVGAITAVLFPIAELDPGVSSGVVYVLGVLLLATRRGLRAGLTASVISAAALDYFHADPAGTFYAKDPGDLVAIAVLLVTATVASLIGNRARHDAERIRLREVEASRARVIQAADEERRRVVRDLHDGAQQRLVHTVVTLRMARDQLNGDVVAALVDEALDNAQRATQELRELAHGILPSVLTRGGLRAGIDALAARMPVPVETDVPSVGLAPAVEATAYFVTAEALTNVAKHAHARHAWVSAKISAGGLEVRVDDDGVGGAQRDGGGLLGLQDRLAALDGRLRVETPHRGGTRVIAEIPLAPARRAPHVHEYR
jgi:signal transduction histidine kinase